MWQCTRTLRGQRLVFEWFGGSYIEVGQPGRGPSEVINVWDYEDDRPTIDKDQASFEKRVDAWIYEYGEEQLVHDVTHNW